MADSPRLLELQQKFEDNPRRYFASLANEYRKAGDLQRAISICRIYLEKQPGHMAGHVVLGQALHAAGNTDEAAEIFKTVLELDPENLIALKCLGDIAEKRGNLKYAHENFRRVLTADPRDQDTNSRLRAVEKELKLAASKIEDWIPPRTSDEFLIPPGGPSSMETEVTPVDHAEMLLPNDPAAIDDPAATVEFFNEVAAPIHEATDAAAQEEPGQTQMADRPALETREGYEAVEEEDFETLLPESTSEHYPSIAEPIEQESAEDSLLVPDLMAEAGESPPVQESIEDYQYRTAEFRLPASEPVPLQNTFTSSEVESEAEAMMEEVEIPPPPPPTEEPRFDHPMRTGEYSLSRDTAEWNRESGEPASALTHDSESDEEVAAVEPAGPFITETVAELYLQQGFTGEALLVYRQLARSKPNDQRIADRIAVLEQRLADEHATRQAALDVVTPEPTPAPEPPAEEAPRVELSAAEEFDSAWDSAPVPVPVPPQVAEDDWFAVPDIAPVRSRQTVHEFFAVLGRAKPEIRRKVTRERVSAADIRAAADITAGFGAFGVEPQHSPPQIPEPASGNPDSQDDVRRFRSWLDGLSDS